jgi:hypothetical protein
VIRLHNQISLSGLFAPELLVPEMFVQGVRRFGFTAHRAAEAVNSYAVRLAKEQGHVHGLVGGMNP